MRKTIFIASAVVMTAIVVLAQNVSTFTDKRDGQTYKTVKIGKQVWMAENLNYAAGGSKCYGEGGQVVIQYDKDFNPIATKRLTDKEIQANCTKYGRLYNWPTAKKACPAGWHLPDTTEWNTLVEYVGGLKTAGTKLKSATDWKYKNKSAKGTDEFGFSALPGGSNGYGDGDFIFVGDEGLWWSATEYAAFSAWCWNMYYYDENVDGYGNLKSRLFSVRCVQD